MEKEGKNNNQKKQLGGSGFLNKNCWLVRNLSYSPYDRCQYCEFRFRNCLFLQYQGISVLLIILSFSIFIFTEKRLSLIVVVTIFTFVIVYGYFFNRSTEKIIRSNFTLKKTKNELKELSDNLEHKVNDQTKDLQKTNKELTVKNRLNQELLAMKTDFLRVVNHQLNTPISVMRAYFSMLKEGEYKKEKALPAIESGLDRITQTVADFWDAYELEGEIMKMNPERVDIAAVVDKIVEEKKNLVFARERKLKIVIEKPKFEVPVIWCDFSKISHAISNLLENAVFYTNKGGVVVSYVLTDGFLKLCIKDTGCGITAEDKKKIFQKFSRGKGAVNLRPDGSGLGLYIAKKIVEGNGGEISFSSAGLGKGTTFCFTVPIYVNQSTDNSGNVAKSENKITIFN